MKRFFCILIILTMAGWMTGVRADQAGKSGFDRYDVVHYDLAVTFDLPRKTFTGSVVMNVKVLDSMATLDFHASPLTLTIDSVLDQEARLRFRSSGDTVRAKLPQEIPPGGTLGLKIFYHGRSIFRGNYDDGGVYIPDSGNFARVFTIGEPRFARRWWPCKDMPGDKATLGIAITVPEGLTAVSNGVLKNVTSAGLTKTFYWETRYPIATYLVSVAAAPYVEINSSYTGLRGDTMNVVYYVYPSDSVKARKDFINVGAMLHFCALRLCEYPFMRDKFAMAEVDGDLTMENQTACSISAAIITGTRENEFTYFHEISHQWWGDLITPRTWHDSWLNEGFATYSEALYLEATKGYGAYRDYLDRLMSGPMGTLKGGVLARSDTSFWDEFGPAVYYKGAIVLHMLRGLLGDTTFFRVLKNYINEPALRYGSASTADFVSVCEKTAGKNLSWFFDEWLVDHGDTTDRPIYRYSWTSHAVPGGYNVSLTIEQPAANFTYTMPMDVEIRTGTSAARMQIVDSLRTQTFHLRVGGKPATVEIDPGHWIYKVMTLRKESE